MSDLTMLTIQSGEHTLGTMTFKGLHGPRMWLGEGDPKTRALVSVKFTAPKKVVFVLDDTGCSGDVKQITLELERHPQLFGWLAQMASIESMQAIESKLAWCLRSLGARE